MPTIEIRIDAPEGTTVSIAGVETATIASHDPPDNPVERYWREYLSDNGRKVYGAAARIEDLSGPGYGLEDIAQNLSISYDSVKSLHRTTGRCARKWREDTGTEPPVRLEPTGYDWEDAYSGMRTTYSLPAGVASAIASMPV